MDTEQSALQETFRYMLLHVGSKLNATNRHGIRFVHHIAEPSSEQDPGIHILEELLARGLFDYRYPDKLQEMLTRIGRKDLSNPVKEYKKSSLFKQMQKQEAEREAQEKGMVSPDGSPERRRRDILPTAYTLATELTDQATKLKAAIKKSMMEGEDDVKTSKALVAITEAQERLEKSNDSLKKALTTAGVKQGKGPGEETTSKKKHPILVPIHLLQKKRAQSHNNVFEDGTAPSSKTSTPPISSKSVRYKPMTMTLDRSRQGPADSTDQASSDTSNTCTGSITAKAEASVPSGMQESQQEALAKGLKEGMRVWERRVSRTSQCSTPDDSGYVDSSWDTRLPEQPPTGLPEKSAQEKSRPYVNIALLTCDDHDEEKYFKLNKTTRNSQHDYVRYGTRETAMASTLEHTQ